MQCAQNPDGSLKDAKDIQWFHDKDDEQPLTATPAQAAQPAQPAQPQPLGRGHRNKAANRFLDAVARERLGSDDEDFNSFTRPPRRKRATRASNISGGATAATPPTLSSRNSFENLPMEDLEDENDENDSTFQSESGSESGATGNDSTELELISNNEVWVSLSYHLTSLSNGLLARRCPAKEDACRSQPW